MESDSLIEAMKIEEKNKYHELKLLECEKSSF